jgi:putative copper export protein
MLVSLRVLILWLHLLGAVVWIGGLLFQLLVIVPTLERAPITAERLRFGLSLEVRFRSVMWLAVGLVLLTGLYNVMHVLYTTTLAGSSVSPAFVRLLSIKLLLVVLMLLLQGVQRLVVQPRRVTFLSRLASTAAELPDPFLRLQRLSHLLGILTVSAAVVVMLLGLLLRG